LGQSFGSGSGIGTVRAIDRGEERIVTCVALNIAFAERGFNAQAFCG